MEQINREEITKTSEWARLVYMLIYAFFPMLCSTLQNNGQSILEGPKMRTKVNSK